MHLRYIQNIDSIGLKVKYIMYPDDTAILYRGKIKGKWEINEIMEKLHKWLLGNKLTQRKRHLWYYNNKKKTKLNLYLSIDQEYITEVNLRST